MIDFGMATKFKPDQVLTELCGSPHYLAPELIGQKYNHLADVWAFGILLYLLMYGHYPYDAKHPRDIMVKILTEPIQWQTKVKLSRDAIDFLKQLLEHNPKKRMSAEAALGHQWMKLADKALEKDTGATDTGLLSPEAIRSAHKKVTATRKVIDVKVDEIRNQKLKKIDEDYSKGIRHGQRLGATPQEEYMSKPEFVRRENKITTAPSRDLNTRRESLSNLVKKTFSKNTDKQKTGDLATIEDGEGEEEEQQPVKQQAEKPVYDRKHGRSQSLSSPPRRLSYIGNITKQEENNLASLYEERKNAKQQLLESAALAGIVPTEQSKNMPQSFPGTMEESESEGDGDEEAKAVS
jgi:serine/threonine protein kinase